MHINFTKDAPYVVMAEEHWDYYKVPSEEYKIFESDNYFDAVSHAMIYYDKCSKQDLEWPWITSVWITPEPVGMHFDYEKYIDCVRPSKTE